MGTFTGLFRYLFLGLTILPIYCCRYKSFGIQNELSHTGMMREIKRTQHWIYLGQPWLIASVLSSFAINREDLQTSYGFQCLVGIKFINAMRLLFPTIMTGTCS